MTTQTDPAQLPRRIQRPLAGLLACGLAAMAVWYAATGGLSGGLVHHDAPPPPSVRFTVDVNEATANDLAQLPGLGPDKAARIVEYRRSHGPFTSAGDLLDVPGIGPVTLAGIRPHLRNLDPPGEPP